MLLKRKSNLAMVVPVQVLCSPLPDAHLGFVHDPKIASEGFGSKERKQALYDPLHGRPALIHQTQNDDAGVVLRWIRSNVGKVQIESDERPLFLTTNLGNGVIRVTA